MKRKTIILGASAAIAGLGLWLPGQASAAETLSEIAANPISWDHMAICESGGDWSTDTGNGYFGGLQFSMETWQAYGGTGSPADASREEQIAMAQKVWLDQGWAAWPSCSKQHNLM